MGMSVVKKLSTVGALAFALAVAVPEAALAAPITLDLVGPIAGKVVGPQSASNPCIIAATQCSQPAGFGFNNFTSNGSTEDYDMYSTTPTATVADGVQGTPYTVGQIRNLGVSGPQNTWDIAIDVNTTSEAGETLELFEVIIGGVVAYNYVGPTNIAANIANNGNGFGDWALRGLDLSSYNATDTVLFHAVWSGASDGGESFFLVQATGDEEIPLVPEPASLVLLGSGLAGIGTAVRRRRARKS